MEGSRRRVLLSSSSSRILWLMVLLIMVSGVVLLFGSKASNFPLSAQFYFYPWAWSSAATTSSPLSYSNEASEEENPVSSEREIGILVASGKNKEEEALKDDYDLNRSSSPPLAEQAIQSQPTASVGIKEEILNATIDGNPLPSDAKSSSSSRIQRKYNDLQRIEARLSQARVLIREAKQGNETHDPDYIPQGPLYRNANAFHRSYLEMENQFKIFVYEEGEPPIFHDGPCKSTYAMEGNFLSFMKTAPFRTKNPNKAQVYFLPMSTTAMVRFIYDRNSRNWNPMKKTVRDYVGLIAGRYPYWNRSIGADHFMLSCHDWGPELSSSVPELFKNSIRALCNANTSEGFKPSKDVSFPEILLRSGTIDGLIGGPSASKRPVLVFFAGGLHGPVRPVLLKHWENKDEDVQVHQYLPKGVSYVGMLKKSRYCICPSGYEVASPRMVEALYTGCVPVLIKDHYVPPFSDVLNWKSFSVEIAVKDIPNMKKILTEISSRQYIRLQRRGKQVRRHFEVNLPPKRYDVFHMILHSVWLRRLNIRLSGVEDS